MSPLKNRKYSFSFRLVAVFVVLTFSSSLIILPPKAQAQTVLNLPIPGTMLGPSASYFPPIVAGMTIHPENPLQLDFIITRGDDDLQGQAFKKESQKLINYFLATLAVPDDEMWVNLSPYEEDRIIADGLGITEMGRDMLIQDYMLKQLTALLMYPEEELGSKFWKKVYEKSQARFGTTEIPTNTFNKVWIVPEKAVVYVNGTNVLISESHLKVMLEEDYLVLEHHDQKLEKEKAKIDARSLILDASVQNQESTIQHPVSSIQDQNTVSKEIITGVSSEIIRELIIPAIEQEVNEGKTFANLRQIYNSMILGAWYKENLKTSVLGQVYANQNKMDGIDLEDKHIKEKIYNQYVEAFEKGVYNYIREDKDPITREMIPRKYFSGGLLGANKIDAHGTSASPLREEIERGNGVEEVRVNLELTDLRGRAISSPVSDGNTASSPARSAVSEAERSFRNWLRDKGYLTDERLTDDLDIVDLMRRYAVTGRILGAVSLYQFQMHFDDVLDELEPPENQEQILLLRLLFYSLLFDIGQLYENIPIRESMSEYTERILSYLKTISEIESDIQETLVFTARGIGLNYAGHIKRAIIDYFIERLNPNHPLSERFHAALALGNSFRFLDSDDESKIKLQQALSKALRTDSNDEVRIEASRGLAKGVYQAVIGEAGVVPEEKTRERVLFIISEVLYGLADANEEVRKFAREHLLMIANLAKREGRNQDIEEIVRLFLIGGLQDLTKAGVDVFLESAGLFIPFDESDTLRMRIEEIANSRPGLTNRTGKKLKRIAQAGLNLAGQQISDLLPVGANERIQEILASSPVSAIPYFASTSIGTTENDVGDASSPVPGGIDFNPNNLDLQEQGQALDFTLDNSMLQNLQPNAVYGIQPVIINIAPITNFVPLLGKTATQDDDGEQTHSVQLLGKLEDGEEQELSQG